MPSGPRGGTTVPSDPANAARDIARRPISQKVCIVQLSFTMTTLQKNGFGYHRPFWYTSPCSESAP